MKKILLLLICCLSILSACGSGADDKNKLGSSNNIYNNGETTASVKFFEPRGVMIENGLKVDNFVELTWTPNEDQIKQVNKLLEEDVELIWTKDSKTIFYYGITDTSGREILVVRPECEEIGDYGDQKAAINAFNSTFDNSAVGNCSGEVKIDPTLNEIENIEIYGG